jgi:hypothetical protein
MSDPALKLATERGSMGIEVDGVRYDLRAPERFGIGTIMRVEEMTTRLRYLLAEVGKQDAPAAVEAELEELLARFTSIIMPDIPEAVRLKLSSQQHLSVITAWRKWFSGPFAKATAESPSTPLPGGRDESRGSDGSMGEAAATG